MVDFISQNRGVVIWTSPKGKTFNLRTTETGYTRKHVGTVKENPKAKKSTTKNITDSNDTFNDLGMAGRDVNLDFVFIGEKHNSEAASFESALCEVGKSRLLLDYGEELSVNVIDFSVKRDLVKNVNSTIVTVNFHETSKTTYPESNAGSKKEIKNAATKTNKIVAQNFTNSVNNASTSASRFSKFTASYNKMMSNVSNALDTANNVSLNSIMTDIVGQTLSSNAFTMTSQLQIVMSKAASLANKVNNIESEFSLNSSYGSIADSWASLMSSLTNGATPASNLTELGKTEIDNLIINDTTAISALTALCTTFIDSNFETRKQAVETAKTLISFAEEWTDFIEEQCEKISNLDDIFIRDSGIDELVSTAAAELLQQSYELKVEKTIVLNENKTLIELAYENYFDDFSQDPDKTIDYLRKSNNFKDDEFFLVDKGTEVKIYV